MANVVSETYQVFFISITMHKSEKHKYVSIWMFFCCRSKYVLCILPKIVVYGKSRSRECMNNTDGFEVRCHHQRLREFT